MKRCGAMAVAVAATLGVDGALGDDLGTIRVESTTIGDGREEKRAEPSNVTVIKGEEVDKAHPENLQQILQSVPGVTTEVQSGDSIKIHIRGVENQRYMGEKPGVAVVIDGVPVFERTGRVNIDLDNIASIKVVKGGASYLFGEDALSGAVIITTKRGAGMAGYELAAEAGSFGYQKGLARAGFSGEKSSGHVQASRRYSDGYYAQSDYSAAYVDGKFQYYLDDKSDLTFGFEHSDRYKDSHGSVEGVTQAYLDPESTVSRDYARRFDVLLNKLFLTYTRELKDAQQLTVNAYQFSDDTDFISAPQRYNAAGRPVRNPDAYTLGNDYAQVQRGLKSEWRGGGDAAGWMAGLDLRANSYRNTVRYLTDFKNSPSPSAPVYHAGDLSDDNHTDETVRAAYTELKFRPAEKWVLTANGRFDAIDLDYSDYLHTLDLTKGFQVFSWRGGANYTLAPKLDAYANLSTGFRTPTVEQLFSGTINPYGSTASNPALHPEQSLNREIGLRGGFDVAGLPLDYDVALFQIDRDDFIQSTAGQYAVPESGTQEQYRNIGGVRNRGVELALGSDAARPLSFSLAYTYLDAVYTNYHNFNLVLGNRYTNPVIEHYDVTGNQVPRTPKHHLNFKLRGRPAEHLLVTGELDSISSWFADDLNRMEIGGHSVFNLLVNYDIRHAGTKFGLFVRADNLFGRRYYNTARGSYDNNGDGLFNAEDLSIVVNPGLTVTTGISAEF